MKIVKLKGGLGNQMFQYAFAKLLQKRSGEIVKLDFSAYGTIKCDEIRVPRLKKFLLSLDEAEKHEIDGLCLFRHGSNSRTLRYKIGVFAEWKLNKKYFFEPNRAYIDPSAILDYSYFDGYWQSWRYVDEVRDDIAADFIPNYDLSEKTRQTRDVMRLQNSVFVGVRRGDFATAPKHFGSFQPEYYERAIEYIATRIENPVFYIFSNDIPWCRANLRMGNYTVFYREPEMQTSDFEELMLMASCKHAITTNSTYHWWGATLMQNPQKIVCCPKKWFFDNAPIDIIPNDWIKIES